MASITTEQDNRLREKAVDSFRQVLLAGEYYRQRAASYFGVAVSDSYALSHLNGSEPLSQGELAERLGITSGGATAMVDRLERADLARRVPDPNDRRRHLLELTPRAMDMLRQSGGRLEQVFAEFSEEQVAQLLDCMREVTERVRVVADGYVLGH